MRPLHTRPQLLAAIALTALIAVGVTGARAHAQQVADARAVAATVQSFYNQTTDVSASFYQTYVHKLYNRTDTSKGAVVFKKPGKMRWDYLRPAGKVIVADGKKVLIYEPGEEGEVDQVIEQKLTQSQLPQAMSFLTGGGKLEDDFTFRLLDAKKQGYTSGHVLELMPKVPTTQYERILFYVESNPKVRGLVRRLLILDANGNRNRFDFSKLKFNSSVGEKPFQWQPPANARRVKM